MAATGLRWNCERSASAPMMKKQTPETLPRDGMAHKADATSAFMPGTESNRSRTRSERILRAIQAACSGTARKIGSQEMRTISSSKVCARACMRTGI